MAIVSLLLLLQGTLSHGQNSSLPPLERTITINEKNTPVRDILNHIAKNGKFSFSYSEKAFNADEKISVNFTNKPVRYILNRIFNGRINYKARGEYIILVAGGHSLQKINASVKEVIVNGYILDSITLQKIPYATVYDSVSFASVNTDAYGYFSMRFKPETRAVHLQIRKRGYDMTEISVQQTQFQSVEIYMKPLYTPSADTMSHILARPYSNFTTPDLKSVPLDVPYQMKGVNFFLGSSLRNNLKNVPDKLFRTAQVSFLPGLGTNKLIGGNVINDFSVNILAGYSLGIKKAEVAGFMNIDRGNVQYLQGAGFANIVGGKVNGLQAAGFMNIVVDTVHAVQGAGFMNINGRETKGVQAAGFYNFSKTMDGIQGAGFCNITPGRVQGMQVAGCFNIAGSFSGLQGAGLYNITAHDFEGAQVSGLINIAGNVKHGMQLGVLNFSDSCNGIPLGFFSYVTHGYHKIEVSANEIFYTNIAFRTGVKQLHNIFEAGVQSGNFSQPYYTLGYGLGSTVTLGKKLDMDIDLTGHVATKDNFSNTPNYTKIYAGLDWHLSKKFSIAFGPDFNAYFTQYADQYFFTGTSLSKTSYVVDEKISNSAFIRGWVGGKVAVRFL